MELDIGNTWTFTHILYLTGLQLACLNLTGLHPRWSTPDRSTADTPTAHNNHVYIWMHGLHLTDRPPSGLHLACLHLACLPPTWSTPDGYSWQFYIWQFYMWLVYMWRVYIRHVYIWHVYLQHGLHPTGLQLTYLHLTCLRLTVLHLTGLPYRRRDYGFQVLFLDAAAAEQTSFSRPYVSIGRGAVL